MSAPNNKLYSLYSYIEPCIGQYSEIYRDIERYSLWTSDPAPS